MSRQHWGGLPEPIREAIRRNTNGVVRAEPVEGGSARIALAVATESGRRVFVKGVRDEPRARIECRVQRYLLALAPRLLWHTEVGDCLLMGFEFAEGRHADLSPGSPDLSTVAATLAELAEYTCPDLPVLPVGKRWASYADDSESLAAITGTTLVHTDLTAENIILGGRTWVVDWAWPSWGAPWLDTAAMVARLVQSGHEPAEAEAWAATVPAWRAASPAAIGAYARLRASVAVARGAPIAHAWRRYLSYLERERNQ